MFGCKIDSITRNYWSVYWTYFTRKDYSSLHFERAMSISQMGRHRPFLIIGNQSIGMERHSKSNFMGAKITSRGFAAPHISRNFRKITKILGVTFRSVFFLWIKTGQNHQHYVKVHVPEMKNIGILFYESQFRKKYELIENCEIIDNFDWISLRVLNMKFP